MDFYMSEYISLEREESSQDPLGLDYIGQQMSNWILPNITTRNSRLRYYPMVCYGIYIINKMLKDNADIKDSDINDNFIKYEKIWAYSIIDYYEKNKDNFTNSDERGLLGRRGTRNAYSKGIKNLNKYKFLERQLQLGGLGAYKSSLVKAGFIKEDSLTLTEIGVDLAESFIHAGTARKNQVDEYFIKMMKDECISSEYSNIKLDKLGLYVSLDYSWNCGNDYENYLSSDEISLVQKYLIDESEIMKETVNLIKKYIEDGVQDILDNICELTGENSLQSYIIEDFKTIRAYENVAKNLLRIFRTLQCELTQNNKVLSMSDVDIDIDYEELKEAIQDLKQTAHYSRIYVEDINFSIQFVELIDFIEMGDSNIEIIEKINDYHNYIYKKRNVKPIICNEGGSLILSYDNEIYDVDKNLIDHTYKIPNICSLLRDI